MKLIQFLLLIFVSPAIFAASVCPAFPDFQPTSGPLALVNCDFHTEYEKDVAQIIKTFGAVGGRPVILDLGGPVIFKFNGKNETVNITPAPYHILKAFSHSAFSVYLALYNAKPGPLSEETIQELKTVKTHLLEAAGNISTMELTNEQKNILQQEVNLTQTFINKLLDKKSFTEEEMHTYFTQIYPVIKQAINKATNIQLTTLNNAVNRWLAQMTKAERKNLAVVMATSHQARAEGVTLQYFAKKFGFRYEVGAENEYHFVVMENKFDEDSALKALARHFLDRSAAQVMLGDPNRLQRDLLSDGAKQSLKSLN